MENGDEDYLVELKGGGEMLKTRQGKDLNECRWTAIDHTPTTEAGGLGLSTTAMIRMGT